MVCYSLDDPKHPGKRCIPNLLLDNLRAAQKSFVGKSKCFSETLAAEPETTADEATNEKTLSPSWIQRIWAAAVEVQRKVIALRQKREALREAREAIELERIKAVADEAWQREAQRLYTAFRKADTDFGRVIEEQQEAGRDAQLLEDDSWPGAVERRQILLKESQAKARQAIREAAKYGQMYAEGSLTAGQQKRLTTAMNNELAYTELVEHLEGALVRAPDRATALENLSKMRLRFTVAEEALLKAETAMKAHQALAPLGQK